MSYFSTLLPPPNLTGILHLGHMWNAILQDTLVRFHKQNKTPLYWGYGLDHAGISLQIKVEEELRREGISKSDLSKEEFLRRLWEWKERHGEIIRNQYRNLSYSLPFEDERFTMDEESQKEVISAFKRLYGEGLIYREKKLVNWDPILGTTISDAEVSYVTKKTKLYYVKYYLEDSEEYLEVATTRPETIPGDVALFVNPNDERYRRFVGKRVLIPLTKKAIPILSDEYIDMSFGTGIMKCTPAHDFKDYELGKKYGLESVEVFSTDLMILVEPYGGIPLGEFKDSYVRDLTLNSLLTSEDYETQMTYSERSGALVQPLMTKQWFLRSSVLAKEALDMWNGNRDSMVFVQSNKDSLLESMFLNMEDWCISRQLDWGIRIPVFMREDEHSLEEKEGFIPSQDVLDTWFSSSLWPSIVFSPRKNMLPLSILISGKDILFFWISRMIFMSVHLHGILPFKQIYLHGLVLDERGKKMSKTKGNGIDPLEVCSRWGHDVLRLFFLNSTSGDSNIRFNENRLDHHSKFLNKFRNAFLFIKNQGLDLRNTEFKVESLNPIESWVLSKLILWKSKLGECLERRNFSFAAKESEDFIWDIFCNKYLEIYKILKKGSFNSDNFLSFLWCEILYAINPLIPHTSNLIWREIWGEKEYLGSFCPNSHSSNLDASWFFEYFNFHQSLVKKFGLDRDSLLDIRIISSSNFPFESFFPFFQLMNNRVVEVSREKSLGKSILFSATSGDLMIEMFFDESVIDRYSEDIKERVAWLEKEIEFLNGRLNGGDFRSRAPEELIEEIEGKIEKHRAEIKCYLH